MNLRLCVCLSALFAVPLVISCNIYQPFTTVSSDQDHIEEALKCLDNNDFACAISNYQALSNATTQAQYLCQVYMTQAGLTLPALINNLTANHSGNNGSSTTVVGDLANALIPWNAGMSTAAANARKACTSYAAAAPDQNFGVMLRDLSFITECAVLMARTGIQQGDSENDTVCSTPGNGGTITQSSLGNVSDGSISAQHPGMCPTDVITCANDLLALIEDNGNLGNGGFSSLQSIVTSISGKLTTASLQQAATSTAAQNEVRQGLMGCSQIRKTI